MKKKKKKKKGILPCWLRNVVLLTYVVIQKYFGSNQGCEVKHAKHSQVLACPYKIVQSEEEKKFKQAFWF